jgi:hypothetical protein
MDAWIDCMSALEFGMPQTDWSGVNLLILALDGGQDFTRRCPDLAEKLALAVNVVNKRGKSHLGTPLLRIDLA